MSDENEIKTNTIRVRWIGENSGYYRDYYKDKTTGECYTLTNFRGVRTWHTTDCNDGEPDMPLKGGLIIEIVADGQVISKESISSVNDCTSIGLLMNDYK